MRVIGIGREGQGGVRAKLYFLSSRHVLGVQNTRIPRVFKHSSSFVREAGHGGKEWRRGGTKAAPKAVILRALSRIGISLLCKTNTRRESRFCTRASARRLCASGRNVYIHVHAKETENRDQVGLLWSNMLPLSLLPHPQFTFLLRC